MVHKSIGMLSHDYDQVSTNHTTGLLLFLHTVLYKASTSSFRMPKKITTMTMSDVFQLDSTHQFFHWKDTTSPSLTCWKQILSNFLKALNPELSNYNTSFFPPFVLLLLWPLQSHMLSHFVHLSIRSYYQIVYILYCLQRYFVKFAHLYLSFLRI
jgi:hypothetical protein